MRIVNVIGMLFVLFSSTAALSQAPARIPFDHGCSSMGAEIQGGVFQFDPGLRASDSVKRVVAAIGLQPNFVVQAANVPNAVAIIDGTQRYVLYSETFFQDMTKQVGDDEIWVARSILAHEIGHHLNGHTLTRDGSRPTTELEADLFSGHLLRLMGANLDQARLAQKKYGNDKGSETHPPRDARVTAIDVGWNRADEVLKGKDLGKEDLNGGPISPNATERILAITLDREPRAKAYVLRDMSWILERDGQVPMKVGIMVQGGPPMFLESLVSNGGNRWNISHTLLIMDEYGFRAGHATRLNGQLPHPNPPLPPNRGIIAKFQFKGNLVPLLALDDGTVVSGQVILGRTENLHTIHETPTSSGFR